jgi:microcystin degradation protein MlrC
MLDALDHDAHPLVSAGAWPSGTVSRSAFATIVTLLEQELATASRLDGVLLNLHGAMVAESPHDPDFELVRRIRGRVGDVPIVAVLDLHGNPSPNLIAACDAVIAYDTYPHVDMAERGAEAAALMNELLTRRPLDTTIAKLPLLTTSLSQASDSPPMRDLFQFAAGLWETNRLRRVSLLPGFPYSDVERAGFSVLAVSDSDDVETARDAVQKIAAEVDKRQDEFILRRDGPARAVERAVATGDRPVLLVDIADNVGGGSPGDGTALLAELLRQRANGAVMQLSDPGAVREAHQLGEGSRIETRIGGKTDQFHGSPVFVRARVVRNASETKYRSRGSWMTGVEFSMGATSVLDADGITVVLTEVPVPPFHSEQLEAVEVRAEEARIIVVKGAIAWRAAYGHLARTVIEVDTPGICPLDPTALPRLTTPMEFGTRRAPG